MRDGPDNDVIVPTARRETVALELGQASDPFRVPLQRGEVLAVRDAPDDDGEVVAARREQAAFAERGHTIDVFLVPHEPAASGAVRDPPDDDPVVRAAGGKLSSGERGQAQDLVRVALQHERPPRRPRLGGGPERGDGPDPAPDFGRTLAQNFGRAPVGALGLGAAPVGALGLGAGGRRFRRAAPISPLWLGAGGRRFRRAAPIPPPGVVRRFGALPGSPRSPARVGRRLRGLRQRRRPALRSWGSRGSRRHAISR